MMLSSLFDIVEYVKLDLLIQDRKKLTEAIQIIQQYSVKILAEKVETKEDFQFCQNIRDSFRDIFLPNRQS